MTKALELHKDKNFIPLLTAVFILSIFVGIILNVIIKYWLISNIDVVKSIQSGQESKKLEKLLDRMK